MERITETHVAVAIVGNYSERWRRNKYTSDFDAWT